jgi:predicted nucleic acid-binding protein
MNYLLDSSALVAYYFAEPGGERVRELLSDDDIDVGISVLTMAEFWSRLRAEGSADAFAEEWGVVSELLTSMHPVTLDVVGKSIELRSAANGRLPQIDALIAATTASLNAVLVHRDPHFSAVPGDLLQQEVLPEK